MVKNQFFHTGRPAASLLSCETNPPLRILVAEDEGVIRRLNAVVLTDSGYKVDTAGDGAVAWEAIQLNSYDLLITDNKMPEMSGMDLLKRLHAARMALPVIMVSGTMPTEELTLQPWLKIAAALLKPYEVDELLATVRNVLHTNELQSELSAVDLRI